MSEPPQAGQALAAGQLWSDRLNAQRRYSIRLVISAIVLLDDGLEDTLPEDLAIESRPAPVRDRASVLKADLEEVLELGVAGRSSVLKFLQGDVRDNQTFTLSMNWPPMLDPIMARTVA
jgi:hypothetical protein